ncbi:hypothetical protein E2C01_031761 [Portunus trituberculatus]|uniref:Uncharacterized protein n=1 Tax=Portunus trituberculatus TaxID=210409 RepID=A0A5B7EXS8_PORTR|nr:hypothetical protein [Portunus trituberculatus]
MSPYTPEDFEKNSPRRQTYKSPYLQVNEKDMGISCIEEGCDGCGLVVGKVKGIGCRGEYMVETRKKDEGKWVKDREGVGVMKGNEEGKDVRKGKEWCKR